jgi:hypothetical protein
MLNKISSAIFLLAMCAVASAQEVKVNPNHYASDAWGRYYNSGRKMTFHGRVTGIENVRPTNGTDDEVTILVKNSDGGGTAVVDLGPAWFVNHQIAKIHIKDEVQVTGRKVIADGHGIILGSQILLGGQGGPVLALRRPSGRAYWMGTEVAVNTTMPAGANVVNGTIQNFTNYTVDNVPYAAAVIQTNDGLTTVDLGPQWYYGRQNLSYQVGQNLQVITGSQPIVINPYTTVLPTYAVYSTGNIYTLRYNNGIPVYNWGR